MMTVALADLLDAARSLTSDGSNPEYDRGIVELIASITPPLSSAYADAPGVVARLILEGAL